MTTDLLSRIAVAELVSERHAAEASVDIVRVARDGDDAVIAARFDNSAGRARRAMFGLREADGEWHRTGGFGGPATAPGDAEVLAGTRAAGRRTAGRSAASGSRIPVPLPCG